MLGRLVGRRESLSLHTNRNSGVLADVLRLQNLDVLGRLVGILRQWNRGVLGRLADGGSTVAHTLLLHSLLHVVLLDLGDWHGPKLLA